MPHTEPANAAQVPLSVRKAREADADVLIDLLGAAFFDDPLMHWAFPDTGRRRDILPDFFRAFVDLSVDRGGAFTTEARDAVVLGLPPDTNAVAGEEAERFEERLRHAAGEYADALLTIVQLQEKHHPRHLGPHFYLAFGAVAPASQGHGTLAAVVAHILEQCDREGVAAYCETSSPGGEAVARAHGFAPIGDDIRIPGGPSLRPMWRPAGQPR